MRPTIEQVAEQWQAHILPKIRLYGWRAKTYSTYVRLNDPQRSIREIRFRLDDRLVYDVIAVKWEIFTIAHLTLAQVRGPNFIPLAEVQTEPKAPSA